MENFDQYYRSYKYMQKHLAADFTANYLTSNMSDNDKGEDVLSGKLHEKVIDMEWVTEIEDTIPYIERAIDEQRRFIIENNEIYRIDKAKIINKDSVKHLIQHTNFIDSIDETGRVTPNKVLTIEREDSYETYENRFLITLIETALTFVADKYRKMVDAPTDTFNKVEMKRDMVLNNQHITFKMEYSNEVKDAKAADLDVKDYENLTDFDRVRRIREKLNSFLNTDMMLALKKCIRVKPPINRTNLMMKNPNYKASLDLFTYLTAYNKPGYEIVGREFSGSMDKDVQEAVYISEGFQHFMISIATNPALKKLLEERYQEQRSGKGKAGDSEIEELIEKVRAEEMKIRLQEIREREKIIRDQKSEIAALKREIEKRDKQIESLKSTIKALEGRIKELEAEVQSLKAELIKAKERIAELEAKVAELEARVAELEAQVAALTTKVAELEEIKAQLEAKIVELEKIIEEQKAKIAEQERIIRNQRDRIEELEAYVAQLEKTKALLESRVSALEAENAQQKATIQAHEATIAAQLATIGTLEGEIASAKSQLSTLTETLAQRDAQIASQTARIEKLDSDVAQLTTDLASEKQSHTADIEAAQAAAKSKEEEMTRLFDGERAYLENKHRIDIEKINKEHREAIERLEKQKEAEKAKIGKDADARVKAAQKDADKKAKAQIKAEADKAKTEARKASKKANEEIAAVKSAAKAVKNSSELFGRDYAFGSVAVVSALAEAYAAGGDKDFSAKLLGSAKNIRSLVVARTGKGVTLSSYSPSGVSDVKLYKKSTDMHSALSDIPGRLDALQKTSPVRITFSGVDRAIAEEYAQAVRAAGAADVSVLHNKQLKAKGLIAIYFCR